MRAVVVGEAPSPLQLPTLVATSTTAAATIDLPMTISPADETQCLRQLLGEGGQFGRAMGEVLDRAQLLGRRRRDGLRFLAGHLRAGARLPEGRGNLRSQLHALTPKLGDLFPGARRLDSRLGDAIEVVYPLGRALDDLPQVAPNPFDQLCGAIQRAAGVLHRLAHVARLAATRPRQLVHKLAEASGREARNVSKAVQDTRRALDRAAQLIERIRGDLGQVVESSAEWVHDLNRIAEAAIETARAGKQVAEFGRQSVELATKITATLGQARTGAQMSSQEAEAVAAAAAEQLRAIQDLAHGAAELSALAEQLSQALRFIRGGNGHR